MTQLCLDELAAARVLTQSRIHDAVARLDPQLRHVCGYHLGWWDLDGHPVDGGGKGVRPELVLLCTQAAGRDPADAVAAAVAVELVHNFSLVHDDVMDHDAYRRHRPTVWSAFGISTALLAGDAMLGLANEILAEEPSPTLGYAVRALNATTRRLIAGQSADLAFETAGEVSLEACLQMEADKTGALLACACSIGPLLTDAPAAAAAGLADFGEHVGLAFQMVDDLLGIWGQPERTGKPVLSDLRARKKSAPVVAALRSQTRAGTALQRLYDLPDPLDEQQLITAAGLVQEAGGRQWAQDRACEEMTAALDALAAVPMPPESRSRLQHLAELLGGRDH